MLTGNDSNPKASDRRIRRTKVLLLVVLLVAFFLRLQELSQQSLWYDEMTSWRRAVVSLDEMFANLFEVRTHTPLYFLLMRGWATIGEGEFVLRYPSTLWGLAGVVLIFRVGDLVGGRRTGLLAAILLAVSPFHIWYSQEARMYTMLLVLAIAANWCLLLLLRKERRILWLAYALSLVLAMYTHFLAIFLPVAHYAFLSVHYRRLKRFFLRWLLYAAGAGLVFAIWVGAIFLTGGFRQAGISWIPAARLIEPLLTLLSLSIGPSIDPSQAFVFVIPLLFVALASFGFVRFGRRLPEGAGDEQIRRALDYRLLLFWFAIPILMIFLISIDLPIPQKRSVYVDRYLLMTLPGLLIAVAWGLDALTDRPSGQCMRAAALIVIAVVSALALNNLYQDESYWREDWRAALAAMNEAAEAGDVVLGRPDHLLPLDYYLERDLGYAELPAAVTDEAMLDAFDEEMGKRIAWASLEADRAWLITHFYISDVHGFPVKRNQQMAQLPESNMQHRWMNAHYQAVEQKDYVGIRLTLYDLKAPLN